MGSSHPGSSSDAPRPRAGAGALRPERLDEADELESLLAELTELEIEAAIDSTFGLDLPPLHAPSPAAPDAVPEPAAPSPPPPAVAAHGGGTDQAAGPATPLGQAVRAADDVEAQVEREVQEAIQAVRAGMGPIEAAIESVIEVPEKCRRPAPEPPPAPAATPIAPAAPVAPAIERAADTPDVSRAEPVAPPRPAPAVETVVPAPPAPAAPPPVEREPPPVAEAGAWPADTPVDPMQDDDELLGGEFESVSEVLTGVFSDKAAFVESSADEAGTMAPYEWQEETPLADPAPAPPVAAGQPDPPGPAAATSAPEPAPPDPPRAPATTRILERLSPLARRAWALSEPYLRRGLAWLNYPVRVLPPNLRPLVDWLALSLVFWVPIVWLFALVFAG